MIKNGFYYPDWIWKQKLHKNEDTGSFDGSCAFCFIEGNRRAGKSVGVGIYALHDFFQYGYKTALIRRYMKDFEDPKKKAMENFWQKSWPWFLHYYPEYKGHELVFDGSYCYIDDKLFSYPVALNLFNDYKNQNFDNVRTIIYDEYVTESGSRLKNEVFAAYNIYDSIARGRPDALKTTSIIFLSNVISSVSDFHVELGIDREIRPDTKRIARPEKGWCLEIVRNEIASETMQESPIARVMKSGTVGRQYLGYSQGNKARENHDFIAPKLDPGENFRVLYQIIIGSRAITIGNTLNGLYLTDKPYNVYYKFAIFPSDVQAGVMLLSDVPSFQQRIKSLKFYYSMGVLRFNSMRTKSLFLDIYPKL